MFASAVVVGPSSGSFYSGHIARGVAFSVARAAVGFLSLASAFGAAMTGGGSGVSALMDLGLVGLMITDLAVAYVSDHAKERGSTEPPLTVAPVLMSPGADGTRPAGLALVMPF